MYVQAGLDIHVNKKKKPAVISYQSKVNWVTGSTRWVGRVIPGHDFSYFFFNPARFQPWVGRVPG
jgi:glycerol-3-phosphate cytidylyltransferase-like family protein